MFESENSTRSAQVSQSNKSHTPVRPSALRFFSSGSTRQSDPVEKQREWTSQYLAGLRAHQNSRPAGPKALPARNLANGTQNRPDPYVRASSALSSSSPHLVRVGDAAPNGHPGRSASALSHWRSQSALSVNGNSSRKGRSIVQPPQALDRARDFSTSTVASNISVGPIYVERGSRWMEKQEARSLREALEDMDSLNQMELHEAAQDEASELVWKHKNPGLPYQNPDLKKKYKSHLETGAHVRSQSMGPSISSKTTGSYADSMLYDRSTSATSTIGKGEHIVPKASIKGAGCYQGQEAVKDCANDIASPRIHRSWDSPQKQAYMNLAFQIPIIKTQGRRVSSGRKRNASGSVFSNAEDRIYEEPEDSARKSGVRHRETEAPSAPVGTAQQDPVTSMKSSVPDNLHHKVEPVFDQQRIYRSEIHRNAPSQTRNPSYMQNSTPKSTHDLEKQGAEGEAAQWTNGKEVRGGDIRAATSKRLSDRSSALPCPTIVSDRPSRPIVSFDREWRQDEKVSGTKRPALRPHSELTSSAPAVPNVVPTPPPSIHADGTPSVISIDVSGTQNIEIHATSPPSTPSSRALPKPDSSASARPKPPHASTTPLHWTPTLAGTRGATALCAACALPISGRIVSASSQRFHPACFSCHHCAELLECVAFYPEPSNRREFRLARAASGEVATPEDADKSLRFYCHLDFHEFFSPRCRNCKTPIEGEVVVACGGEWHVGHFFCAECGDPFGPQDPFVEKEGYAWCVRCHQQRSASRCKGCKKPVIDGGVEALGGQWHEGCFKCVVG